MITPIVFFLVATVCTEDSCKRSKLLTYGNPQECQSAALAMQRVDDRLFLTCEPYKKKEKSL